MKTKQEEVTPSGGQRGGETIPCDKCSGVGRRTLSCGICYSKCPNCGGSGRTLTPEAMLLKWQRDARLKDAAPALYEAAKKAANELSVMLALNPARDGGLYREALDALNAALALVDGPQIQEAQ